MSKKDTNIRKLIYTLGMDLEDIAVKLGIKVNYLRSILKPSKKVPDRILTRLKVLSAEKGIFEPSTKKIFISKSLRPFEIFLIIRKSLNYTRKSIAIELESTSQIVVLNWEKNTTKIPAEAFQRILSIGEENGIFLK